MRKRILSLSLVLAMAILMTLLPITVSAYDVTQYGDLYYTVNEDGTIEIIGCTKSITYVVIPSEIDGKTVKSIDGQMLTYGGYSHNNIVEKIFIPNTVTYIKPTGYSPGVGLEFERMFGDCTALSCIEVAEDNEYYKSIDGVLFDKSGSTLLRCPSAKTGEYHIPDGVIIIGEAAFTECELENISVPDTVLEISKCAFACCSNLTNVNIPEGIFCISNGAFEFCSSLPTITIPQSVIEINAFAFAYCYELSTISCYTQNIKTLGNRAFAGTKIEQIDISQSEVEDIGGVFWGCKQLKSIELPKGLKTLSGFTFRNCSSLTSVTIPYSVINIGSNSFYGCDSLADIYYNGSNSQWNNKLCFFFHFSHLLIFSSSFAYRQRAHPLKAVPYEKLAVFGNVKCL